MRPYLFLILVACGSSKNNQDGGDTNDGGTISDGSGTNDGGPNPNTKFVGNVSASSTDATLGMMQVKSHVLSGAFFARQMSGTSPCTTTNDGPCVIYDCPVQDAGTTTDAGSPTFLSAGTLSFNGTMIPRTMGGTYLETGMTPLFQGGETITMNATGDAMGAPAFMLSLTAPSRIQISAPMFPDLGMPFMLDRTQALPFTWTNGTSGKVQVYVGFATSTRTVSMQCTFDAKAGSGTVPASALGKLPAMANGSISASVYDQIFTTVGDWALGFTATNTAVTSTMKQAYATATTK